MDIREEIEKIVSKRELETSEGAIYWVTKEAEDGFYDDIVNFILANYIEREKDVSDSN